MAGYAKSLAIKQTYGAKSENEEGRAVGKAWQSPPKNCQKLQSRGVHPVKSQVSKMQMKTRPKHIQKRTNARAGLDDKKILPAASNVFPSGALLATPEKHPKV